MMAILVSIFAMTACQKDKADDTWKQLPVGQISVESGKATISVNDIPCNYGNVQLVADSDDAATLTLTGQSDCRDSGSRGFGSIDRKLEHCPQEQVH